jgi:hypothetical protein
MKGGIMQEINEIKYNIKELQKKYYEVEKELKKSNNYTLGDGSDEDIENSKKILLWINIRNEIFYNRIKLVKAYETIL